MLSTSDKRLLLSLATGVKTDYPRDCTIHAVFERHAKMHPTRIALDGADHKITYHQLDTWANNLASELQSKGVGHGKIVAYCMQRGVDAVALQLGILKAGGAYLPLPPEYPAGCLRAMLENARPPIVATTRDLFSRLPRTGADVVLFEDLSTKATRAEETPLHPAGSAGDAAYVMYTSGTTGVPKGVVVPHRAVNRLVCQPDYVKIEKQDRFLQYAPLAFDAATFEIWGPLLNGATLVLAPPGLLTLRELSNCILENRVTTLWLTAGLFHEMVAHNIEGFRQLRHLLAGGDVLSVEAVRQVKQAYPSLHLINGYGPTENTTFSCCYAVDRLDQIAEGVPIGRPICNSEAYVLDASQQLVDIGEEGELYVGGDGLALGYLGDAQLTEERFVQVQLAPQISRRLYRTGDRVRWNAHGDLEFLGRVDSQFKLRGYRIEPGDVEAVLRRHEKIRDASVGVTKDATGGKRLLAYIVLEQTASLELEELRTFSNENLPHSMVPGEYRFLERLPLTANGKVDRVQLFDGAAKPSPARSRESLRSPHVSERVAQLWAEVLPIDRVEWPKSFLESGGDSLRAIQLAARIQRDFHVEVAIDDRFFQGTIDAHALAIERQTGSQVRDEASELMREVSADERELSPAQARLWFLQQLDPSCQAYHISLGYKLVGEVDVDQLKCGFAEIVRRHDPLRTSFLNQNGRPLRRVHDSADFSFEYCDLRCSDKSLEDWKRDYSQQPMDLLCGPLFRVALARHKEQEFYMLLLVHHLVFDGWSESVLFRELATLLRIDRDLELGLPALPARYSDFVRLQRRVGSTAIFESDRSYWREQLRGVPDVLQIPTDRPRPTQRTWKGQTIQYRLPMDLTTAVKEVATAHRTTPFVLLLSAFEVLLHRLTGQYDFVVGTAIANRQKVEFEPLIGFFANTVALRADLAAGISFEQLIKRVGQTVEQAIAHQAFPFDQVVDELRVERNPDVLPLVQIAFVMHEGFLDLPGLRVEREPIDPGTAKFDVTFIAVEDREGLQVWAEYNTDLFTKATILRWTRAYEQLLGEITSDATRIIDSDADSYNQRRRLSQKSASPCPVDETSRSSPGLEGVQRKLEGIWEDLTGVSPIHGDHNFFQAGGNSLMAVQLAARIESVFGRAVSIRDLFRHPTLAQQAMLVAGETKVENGDSLICYREGTEADIVLLPKIAGNAYAGEWVLTGLPQELGVHAIDLDTKNMDVESATVSELASRCVDLLEREGIAEPFRLLGYSFGGILAYETAIQLESRGHEVRFVGLIDAGPAQTEGGIIARLRGVGDFLANGVRWFTLRWQQGAFFSSLKNSWSKYRLLKSQRVKQRGQCTQQSGSDHSAGGSSDIEKIPLWLVDLNANESQQQSHFIKAYLRYRPPRYDGEVTLFRARLRSPIHHFSTDAGWKSVPVPNLDIRVVPGSHQTMVEHPNCLILAREVRDALEKSGLDF